MLNSGHPERKDITSFDADLSAALDWLEIAEQALARSDIATAGDAVAHARDAIERKAGLR